MNKIFFAFIILILASNTLLAADNTRSDSVDIKHYHIQLHITDFVGQTIRGFTDIDINFLLPAITTTRFDLLMLTVDSVQWNGVTTTDYIYDTKTVNINHPSSSIGDSARVRIYYHGSPQGDASGWGGWYWSGTSYAYNLGVGFAADPHNYGRVWFPCFDNFIERSTYEFHITTNNTYKAFCNGTLQSTITNPDGTKTWHWKLNQSIPTYLASVAVANWVTVSDIWTGDAVGPIAVELGCMATDSNNVKASFINLLPTLDGYESDWGPYLWDRVGYVMVPFSSGAMEHATNIAYPNVAANGTLVYENLYAHELSHHWFGNLVTCRTQEDMWLNEGWASYSEQIFYENIYGLTQYKNAVRNNHLSVMMNAHIDDGDYLPISGVSHENTYGTHVYKKGADVAHTLRGYMGDTDFFDCIKNYLDFYKFQSVNSDQLRDFLSSCSGKDCNNFFDVWVYGAGFPHFDISDKLIIPNASNFDISFTIRQRLHHATTYLTNYPVEVTFFDSNWNSIASSFIVSNECSEVAITLPFQPIFIACDFNEKISDAITDEYKIVNTTGNKLFTHGKVTINISSIVDSNLIRVAHHYVKAEKTSNLPSYVHLADRYWHIDGIWDTDMTATIKFDYNGTVSNSYLDQNFITTTEDSIKLYYRASEIENWELVPDVILNTLGSTTNKIGNITALSIRKGYYTFGINDGIDNTSDITASPCLLSHITKSNPQNSLIKIIPNPTNSYINITWDENILINTLYIYNTDGKLIDLININNHNTVLDIGDYSKGSYYVLGTKDNIALAKELFVIQ